MCLKRSCEQAFACATRGVALFMQGSEAQREAQRLYDLQYPEQTSAAALMLDKTRAVVLCTTTIEICP